MSITHKARNLAHKGRHLRARQMIFAAGQRVRADFDDKPLAGPVTHVLRRSFYIGL